ncbi:MAG: peptidylprolyl isomerase [Ignavibacteriales bacterium]|nr:peptidylprolyl isomerase [Ignavibacteriales bacterium]
MNKPLVCTVLFFAGHLWAGEPKPQADTIVANIGSSTISVSEFTGFYSASLRKFGLSDNLGNRQKVLNELVSDKLLALSAKQTGLDKTRSAKLELQRITVQELLNRYSSVKIKPGVVVEEADMKEIYRRMNTQVKVSHLYAKDKQTIDKIFAGLQAGNNFDSTAEKLFTDPVLRKAKGSLGYISYDEMDAAFEDAAFNLASGTISSPVKTNYGYSIIRVEDIRSTGLLTEPDFINKKPQFERIARRRKLAGHFKLFSDSIRIALHIEFSEKAVNTLFAEIQKNTTSSLMQSVSSLENTQLKPGIVVLKTIRGSKTIEELRKIARFTSDGQKRFIQSVENLKDFIAGIVIREEILKAARKLQLDKEPGFNKDVQEAFENYLSAAASANFKSGLKVPDSEAAAYYQANISNYTTAEQLRIASILVDDAALASGILNRVRAGERFEELARGYSLQKALAEKGGDMGFYSRGELKNLSAEFANAEVGDIIGPLKQDNKFVIMQVTGKKPLTVQPFEEVKSKILQDIITMRWMRHKQALVQNPPHGIAININQETLKKATWNETN